MSDRFVFRPPTNPMNRNNIKARQRLRRQLSNNDFSVIQRPRQNFFKLIFQKDTYLWVIFHLNIRNIEGDDELYHKMVDAYRSRSMSQNDLPICTNIEEFKKWTKRYQCRVAIDESAVEHLDEVLADQNTITIRVINVSSIDVLRKIRSSKYNSKVRSIEDNYDQTLAIIREDMQRVKIVPESSQISKIEKIRLPNFMQLRIKDKASLITYRSNIYCLSNLHLNKIDMETSKNRFIEQCKKEYTSSKDQQYINYYLTYPFNDNDILKFYTEDSFFYRCLNNTLRIAEVTEQFFIIGEPFNKMFHAIKNIYRKQYPIGESRSSIKLYRGSDLSEDECLKLESSIGGYIQIHGFVSTTLDVEVAKKFATDRKHNKIIEIVFDDITTKDAKILENDYGFVNLKDISRFEQAEVLFNTLNIFKVKGKEVRDGFQYYTLRYGSIFNVMAIEDPDKLKKDDRLAYYTYKELMGQKSVFQDLGQVFLKNNETQKSVDYYEAKILQARGQGKLEEVGLVIKRSEALIQNGEPAKALQSMQALIKDRGSINITNNRAQFLQSILNNKQQIIKQIDITKKYSQAGHSLDKFEATQTYLTYTNEALEDALRRSEKWDFDVAYSQVQMKMRLAHIKQSMQRYQEMAVLLRQAQSLIDEILRHVADSEISFHNKKLIYLQKTLIYQKLAKISSCLEGDEAINIETLEQKYNQTEKALLDLIEEKSYDRSLVQIRKIEIYRRKEDFNKSKQQYLRLLEQSVILIKGVSTVDEQIPKTYHMMAEISKDSKTVSSTNTAIGYYEKEYITQSQYYGEQDPRPMKTVIDIAQCHRNIKDSQASINLLREQMQVVPFKNTPNHTIVTKTLYTMGLAYLDLGEFSYALKCFEKGLNMLQQTLTSVELQKYHHKYKIELQLGRTLTFLLKYNEAEDRLNSYHRFIVKLHKEHSDIANSLNYFAILYLKWAKVQQPKLKISMQRFQESSEMFKRTTGYQSLMCAKINCNLGMIYAIYQKKQDKALRTIDKAKQLFDTIYIKDNPNETVHSDTCMLYFYYAEIYRMFKDWKNAISNYKMSLSTLAEYNKKKKEEKENLASKIAIKTSKFYKFSEISLSKKGNHELFCRVKIIECQIRVKDYHGNQLDDIIRELERETIIYDRDEQDPKEQPDSLTKDQMSQLKNLLAYCRSLSQHYKGNRESKDQHQLYGTRVENLNIGIKHI